MKNKEKNFHERLKEICIKAGEVLYAESVRLYAKLTEEEKKALDDGSYKLPKAIVLALPPIALELQLGAETIIPIKKKVRRILYR